MCINIYYELFWKKKKQGCKKKKKKWSIVLYFFVVDNCGKPLCRIILQDATEYYGHSIDQGGAFPLAPYDGGSLAGKRCNWSKSC